MKGTEKQIAWANDIIAKLRECCDMIVAQSKDDNAKALLAKGADAYLARLATESGDRADWYIGLFGDITNQATAEVESGWGIRGQIVGEAKRLMAA